MSYGVTQHLTRHAATLIVTWLHVPALHIVNAFLVWKVLTLAQVPCAVTCAVKVSEIAALHCQLDHMVLEGALVTIDPTGCQRAIVQALRTAGAYYMLAVKHH